MRGETRSIEVEATFHGVTRDASGQDRVAAEVRGTISRGDFGLRWQQALETGGVMVGDEVRVSAHLSAICTRKTDT
jgi:polyisoprenoid-binding protein YceI